MVAAGVHIVPLMPARDVISVAVEAERLGYDYCVVADEGFHPDVYACLGAIAMATDRITLGVLIDALSSDLSENLDVLSDSLPIIHDARP